jgi:ribosomal protein L25 (general stress protein Ctc)
VIGQGEPSQSGWSDPEREVMALTDRLYDGLRAEGRRRPSRGAVRSAARELGKRIEVVYGHEEDGCSWRRACRTAANELGPEAHGALATLAVAGSDMSRGLAEAERRRAAGRAERRAMDRLFGQVRALRREGVRREDTAEALYCSDPAVVLDCLEGYRPFGAALLSRHAGEDHVEDAGELARAIVLGASPVARVRELRPEVAAMRRRVEVGEFSEQEAVAELRARTSRGRERRTSGKPAEERTQLPAPSRREPERVWEFPGIGELAEAMPPMLPAGAEPAGAQPAATEGRAA